MKKHFQTNAELNQKMARMVAQGWKAIPCSGGYIMIKKSNVQTITSQEKLCKFTDQSQLTG